MAQHHARTNVCRRCRLASVPQPGHADGSDRPARLSRASARHESRQVHLGRLFAATLSRGRGAQGRTGMEPGPWRRRLLGPDPDPGLSEYGGSPEGHEVEGLQGRQAQSARSEEHTSELKSLMRNPYAVFCLKKKPTTNTH